MNWQTKEILKKTKEKISDTGVFSEDQISLLIKTIDGIAEAIEQESGCISGSINHSL